MKSGIVKPGVVKSGIVKSGTVDAAMLPALQNLTRDQEPEGQYSVREARELGRFDMTRTTKGCGS